MSKSKKEKAMKLPKLIYVTVDGEGYGQYLAADATPDSKEDGDKVGLYELREIQTKKITHSLEKPKKSRR